MSNKIIEVKSSLKDSILEMIFEHRGLDVGKDFKDEVPLISINQVPSRSISYPDSYFWSLVLFLKNLVFSNTRPFKYRY